MQLAMEASARPVCEAGAVIRLPSGEDLNSMTLQVAMVGKDAAVLASDTANNEPYDEIREVFHGEKIVDLSDVKVAYAFSGDECAREVGRRVARRLREHSKISVDELTNIANQTYKDEAEELGDRWVKDLDRRLILVSYADTPRIQVLRISHDSKVQENMYSAVAGDYRNLARFFITTYFRKGLPLAALKSLAAQLIVTGAHLNSAQVGGLQILAFHKGTSLELDDSELEALTRASHELHEYIGRRLLEQIGIE